MFFQRIKKTLLSSKEKLLHFLNNLNKKNILSFKLSRPVGVTLIILLSLVGYGALVFASPNIPGGPLSGSGGFSAGTELDPDCAPNQVAPEPCMVKLPPGESTTVSNGLTLTGTNVQLGGTLVQDTAIVQGTKTLTSTFDGTTGSYSFVNGNYGPLQAAGMLYIPTATPYIITGSIVSDTGANLFTRNYITTEQSAVSAFIDAGTGEHRASLSSQASDASNMYAFTTFGQQGKAIMSEYNDNIDFTSKMIQIGSDSIIQEVKYSRIDNQNYLYNQAVMDDSFLSFSIGNSVVAGVFSGSGKEYKLSNMGHEFNGLDLFANQYPNTRDDSGAFSPVNFLYTDSSGKILSAPTSLLGGSGWSLTGNTGTTPGTNFIGTTDAKNFMVKTNGNQVALFGQNGNVAIGGALTGFGIPAPVASGIASIAIGSGMTASGLGSIAIGAGGNATGDLSVVLGSATASGIGSFAMSNNTTILASGNNSFAFGSVGTRASGSGSIALVQNAFASGDKSIAIGEDTKAYSANETVFGYYNTQYLPISTLFFNSVDRLFTVGNGSSGLLSDAFTILKNGKTGIGYDNFETTAFDSLLQVNGSILSANLPSTQDDTGVFTPVNFLYTDTNGKLLSSPLSAVTGNMWSLTGNSGTTAGTNFIGTTDAKDLVFKTSNTEAIRIASDGRVAIGTAPALGKILTIAGDVKITGVLDPTKLVFSDGTPSSFDPSTNNRYEIDYGARDLLFTSSGSSNPLFLSNAGNVGIGVNSGLLATLDVRGTGLLRTVSNSATGFQIQDASANSVLDVDTVNRRVGINTTSPTTDFSLLGVATTSGVESGRMLIKGQAPNGYGGLTVKQCLGTCATEIESTFSVGTSGIPYAYIGTSSNHRVIIQTNFVQRMVFDTTGNVGIGVAMNATIPDKFQVLGDIRTGTATTNGCIKNFAGTGIIGTCSSDERLKTNIIDITGALDKIKSLRPVTYQWNSIARDLYNNNTDVTNRGFLAQNIESIYPELVITDSNGYKQVDYSGMGIYTAAAVKELAIKLDAIEKVSSETLLQGSLRQWFADTTNGITDFFAGRIRTNELCIGSTCLNEAQVQQILQSTSVTPTISGGVSQSSTTTEQTASETTTNQVIGVPVSNDLGNNIDTLNDNSAVPIEPVFPSENIVQ